MFYYAIYVTTGKKIRLYEKADFETIQRNFVLLAETLDHVCQRRYSVKNGQRVLSSFLSYKKGQESRYVFRRFKKLRIVPSSLR